MTLYGEPPVSLVEDLQRKIADRTISEETPLADSLGPVPHLPPEPLAQRVRSAGCLTGEEDCTDPHCGCTCHTEGPSGDIPIVSILAQLDEIIRQTPGTWGGFTEPADEPAPSCEACVVLLSCPEHGASRAAS